MRTEDKMREKADGVMRAQKDCMSDSFSTIRNGHVCIPVKKECKSKVSGVLIDKSSTGSTLFIEIRLSRRIFGSVPPQDMESFPLEKIKSSFSIILMFCSIASLCSAARAESS